MIRVTVDTKQLERHLTDMQRKALPKGIARALKKSAKAVEAEVKPLTPVNLGRLKRNIRSTATKTEAKVGTNVHYAPYVEFGTRPHWPPLEPILRWVTQKARGKGFRGAFGIQRRGFERGLKAALPAIKTIFRTEIEKAIRGTKGGKPRKGS